MKAGEMEYEEFLSYQDDSGTERNVRKRSAIPDGNRKSPAVCSKKCSTVQPIIAANSWGKTMEISSSCVTSQQEHATKAPKRTCMGTQLEGLKVFPPTRCRTIRRRQVHETASKIGSRKGRVLWEICANLVLTFCRLGGACEDPSV